MDIKLRDKAVAKITDEALKINNAFSIFIEEYLTSICTTDAVANKLLTKDKKLENFCRECESEARAKARKQGSGVQINGLPDAEYFEIVEAYYEITPEDKNEKPTRAANVIDFSDFI